MTRAAIYTRISDDREGAGLGVARQEADCKALCAREGHQVTVVHSDNDISAYSGKRRPGYRALLDAIKAGDVDVVVAWHPDRLHRSPRELEDFIDLLEQTGCSVHTVQAGTYDLSTPTGRMTARIVGATAKHESEHKSERIKRKHRELAEAGLDGGGGSRPFGYAPDRVTVDPDEAALIHEAAQRVLNGDSLRAICNDWNQRGITSTVGAPWTQTPLRRALTSWRIAGIRSHKGQPVAEAVWDGIVDRRTVERLRAVLLDPSRTTTTGFRRSYPLRGILWCTKCQRGMYGRPRADKVARYICPMGSPFYGCGRAILAEPTEDRARDLIAARIRPATLAKVRARVTEADAEYEAAFKQLQADEADLEALAVAMYVDKTITPAQFNAANRMLQARVDATRKRLAGNDAVRVLTTLSGDLATLWDNGDAAYRHTLAAAVFERLELGPAVKGRNRVDVGRIRPVWRV